MKKAFLLLLLIVSSLGWGLEHSFNEQTTGGNVTAQAFSGNSKSVVEGNENGILKSFSLSTGNLENQINLNSGAIKDIKLSPTKPIYAVCTENGLFLLNSSNLAIINQTQFPDGECTDIEWLQNGKSFTVVGKQNDLSQIVVFNSNLTVDQRINVDLELGGEIYDSSISQDGKYIVIAGYESSNTTASNVLVYELGTGILVSDIDIPAAYINTKKKVEFGQNGKEIAVLYEGTNTVEIHKKNNNKQWIKEKDLIFGSGVVDMKYTNDKSLAVLRENGTSSIVDFVSVSDSNGTNVVTNDQIIANKGKPTSLEISPNGKYAGISFSNSGLNIYTRNARNEAYIPVIAAVVGVVVAGSIGAVVASTSPVVMGAAGINNFVNPTSLIGISEVQNIAGHIGDNLKTIEESGKGIL